MYLVGTGRVRVIVRVESSRRVERVESDLGTYTYAYCTDTGRSIPPLLRSIPPRWVLATRSMLLTRRLVTHSSLDSVLGVPDYV